VGSLEAQAFDFLKGEVLDAGALAGLVLEYGTEIGTADYGAVVAEHKHGVLGHLEVELHDIDTHLDNRLDSRDGILREVPPVAPVRGNYYILGRRIVNLRNNLFCTSGILRSLGRTSGKGKCRNRDKRD
jgi:hypothetical protein